MALAGYKESDLDITVEDGTLTVEGGQESGEDESNFIHQGIAQRKFRKVKVSVLESLRIAIEVLYP